ncbi:15-cis-phytoene synthase [Meridianimarinicoccus aquatilis]|uniref:Phytoene/squalene synthase family protein n=1 Tax=Meridianimarinicoccus aquatilis TaxID=2552766 RepID=A0A4V3BC18_9RHOB|nr:phytoene/squalene synthase family protein [Fluviibacterium aquatile]TDL89189.1 phytoene/squalene synthase family protein [Fluviibacterium aquatile]
MSVAPDPRGVPLAAPQAPASRGRSGIAPADLDHCTQAIRHGSRSFYAASLVMPPRVRDPALALYAFCRLADDAVDLQAEKAAAVLSLRDRLDLVYAGTPRNTAPDRAFAAMVDAHEMPRALPEALLEGLAWDAMERRYASLSDLRAYSARVASAVGAMMCVLMGVRDRHALARACDLGVAMQLTNIARDVGEDAREGRLYLPTDWLAKAGIEPAAFLASPAPTPQIRALTARLLREADMLYARSEAGVAALPLSCRLGIFAARYIYAGISGQLRRNGHDSISVRAHTGTARKLGWLGLSMGRAAGTLIMPRSPMLYARPLAEVAFLVDAAGTQAARGTGRADALVSLFAQLEQRDRRRTGLNAAPPCASPSR